MLRFHPMKYFSLWKRVIFLPSEYKQKTLILGAIRECSEIRFSWSDPNFKLNLPILLPGPMHESDQEQAVGVILSPKKELDLLLFCSRGKFAWTDTKNKWLIWSWSKTASVATRVTEICAYLGMLQTILCVFPHATTDLVVSLGPLSCILAYVHPRGNRSLRDSSSSKNASLYTLHRL